MEGGLYTNPLIGLLLKIVRQRKEIRERVESGWSKKS